MIKASRTTYLIGSWLVLAGITIQVLLAGMVVVAGQSGWANHRDLGHAMGLPLLVMVITVYLGRMPGSMKRMTWLLFVVYIIQADVIIFMRGSAPIVSAFHPVLALIDFALAVTLARRAWSLLRQNEPIPVVQSGLDPAPVE